MGAFEKFPYTNFHDLNLDWFLAEFKKLQDEWDSFGYTVTATAVVGTVPSVEVTGDLLSGLNFKFTLVKGETGEEGPQGETGNGISAVSIDSNYQITFTFTDGTSFTTPSLKGPQGEGLEVLDVYATLSDLQAAHPSGNSGDMYLVGVSPSFMLYVWSTSGAAWVQAGALSSPSPSVTTPLMDGTADNGTEFAYARGDHRHPTDTSRASASDLSALQTTVSGKADQSDLTALTGRVSTAEGNISLLSNGKQDKLISGTNIATLNNNSLLSGVNYDVLTLLGVTSGNGSSTFTNSSAAAQVTNLTVDGDGFVILTASVYSDGTSGSGAIYLNMSYDGSILANDATIEMTTNTSPIGASATMITQVTDGKVLQIDARSTRAGTKTVRYSYLAIGCTISV